jgi:hypothetical protein
LYYDSRIHERHSANTFAHSLLHNYDAPDSPLFYHCAINHDATEGHKMVRALTAQTQMSVTIKSGHCFCRGEAKIKITPQFLKFSDKKFHENTFWGF